MTKEEIKTKSFTDAEGTKYILNAETREIISSMDRNGFIYNSKGERTGNIHGHKFITHYQY
jgi:hypothetical protein